MPALTIYGRTRITKENGSPMRQTKAGESIQRPGGAVCAPNAPGKRGNRRRGTADSVLLIEATTFGPAHRTDWAEAGADSLRGHREPISRLTLVQATLCRSFHRGGAARPEKRSTCPAPGSISRRADALCRFDLSRRTNGDDGDACSPIFADASPASRGDRSRAAGRRSPWFWSRARDRRGGLTPVVREHFAGPYHRGGAARPEKRNACLAWRSISRAGQAFCLVVDLS